ncbi:circularly permuted type 2 ATP-grasp protein [Nocardioides convexus]|uniref:circularly permuted type 2 ATP-grasp protein n=1 Tax=Nocardioides convexus TaxID=2712224 RepID=UPI0024185165|nr:circularly permuted type 2 ATP-grasp protein [Nocardioides convexus]
MTASLGVAGLAEAVRRGRVRVVNGLGAGVLENPGLLPFLPAACEHLLGEPLRLPSVPTWWCGDPAGLEHVLSHLDESRGALDRRLRLDPRRCLSRADPAHRARPPARLRRPAADAPVAVAHLARAHGQAGRVRRCGRSRCATARRTGPCWAGSPPPATATARSPARTCGSSRRRPGSRTRGSPRCCR